ncbi:MAG: hypothetical protein FWE82_08965, partial [Defluviitaleaceae bacterium]|nr:hypothetical protein [Defluviitaleaceae bacterium]
DIIDRPIVRLSVHDNLNTTQWYNDNYYTRMHNGLDEIVEGMVNNASKQIYFGEAIPSAYLSFGCDELAAFCGGTLQFTNNDQGTSWSVPFVENWEDVMPIAINEDNQLWLRMQSLCEKCAAAMDGRMLFSPIDTHSNMDLLLAMRGPGQLCMDLIEIPETIDRAMEQTMDVFDTVYKRLYKKYGLPSGAGITLQCDFSCMVGTPMFRRFVLPYLEREAAYFGGRTFYHWDGINALTHTDDLIASKGLYVMAFVPGYGNGEHKDFIELYQKIQKHGKAVSVWGNPDEVKYIHKHLKPELTVYDTFAASIEEAESLLDWFKRNT